MWEVGKEAEGRAGEGAREGRPGPPGRAKEDRGSMSKRERHGRARKARRSQIIRAFGRTLPRTVVVDTCCPGWLLIASPLTRRSSQFEL